MIHAGVEPNNSKTRRHLAGPPAMPVAAISVSLNHLIGRGQQRFRDGGAQGFGRFQIDGPTRFCSPAEPAIQRGLDRLASDIECCCNSQEMLNVEEASDRLGKPT
jgi:hypothetical protein